MRSRGVICHTYQNAIAKPWGKLLSKKLKGAGITGDTVMMRGGPSLVPPEQLSARPPTRATNQSD